MMKKTKIKGHILASIGLTTLLAACGGGSDAPPPDPMDAYRQQTLAWEACDPSIAGANYMPFVEAMGDRARCANMRVPLDHVDPSKGEAVVALLRVAARKPEERRGAIFFNPGGPGGDGLWLAPMYGLSWSKDDPVAARKQLNQMADRYDLIGFSPRGTGASTNLYCGSNELKKNEGLFNVRSPDNIDATLHNAKLTVSACKKNPLTRYINTDQTARDMDLARELLGDKKLSYIGYSYGTWLGTWYASLFPERVDRMLLDSSLNFNDSLDQVNLWQPVARQRILDEVLAPYAARHTDVFELGANADAVRKVFPSLNQELQFLLGATIANGSYQSGGSDKALQALSMANKLNLLLARAGTNRDNIHDVIEGENFYPLDPDRNAEYKSDMHGLANTYISLLDIAKQPPSPVALAADSAVLWAVHCNDTPSQTNPQFWIDKGNDYATRYPLTGGNATSRPCMYWGGPTTVKPAISGATKVPGILMVQSQYDGATATEGAMATWKSLPNARMIMVNSEYTHAVFPYGTTCVDERVARYFLDGTLPDDEVTACDGKALTLDQPAAKSKQAKTSRKSVQPQDAQGAPAEPTSEEINRKIREYIHDVNRPRLPWPLK